MMESRQDRLQEGPRCIRHTPLGVIFGLVPCTSSRNHGSQTSDQIIATSHDLTPNDFISEIKVGEILFHLARKNGCISNSCFAFQIL